MALLSLLVFSFAGSIVWLFNVEAAAMVAGSSGRWSPLVVGVTCALGQALGYTVLFHGGDLIFRRWRWGRRRVDRTRERYGDRLRRCFYGLTATAALVGLPPMTAMAAVAGGFRVRFVPMIAIALALRIVRLTVLAAAGGEVADWWNAV